MTPDEFRKHGHEIVDWIADYRERLAGLPVMARTEPGEIKDQLPGSAPDAPEAFGAILEDLDRLIVPGLSHWQHPSFFGYFPANAPLSSVLGDFASTGLGVLGLSWQSSPALTELEEVVVDWLRQLVGLSGAWTGVIQDTASTSTLVALICARERATGHGQARGGLQSEPAPLVIYASDQAHSSVEKAALLAGFGRENVRSIQTDAAYAMDAHALGEAIRSDRANGRRPCAVVATTGTTASTAIDPLGAIAGLAREQGLWLHVDAAMAGSAMILPECRGLWEGVEGADSIVLNAHKWLGVAFDSSLYYVRDPEHLVRVMSTNPSYLRSTSDERVKNLRDWGIPLGRRFRALKLWFLLRLEGVAALQARLRRDIENARWLEEAVRAAPGWSVVAPVPLQTVCVRHQPPGLEGEALDDHTRAWAERVNRSGAAYLTPATLGGRWMVRVSIGAETTEREQVEALWAVIRREAERG
ncbi:pyridoxal phosphate-dependent decarboxylase family protein [Tundrisphaera lichenicola]|uniref:pyridoxal phosphate-dependent decarboxylase family protein n=1 Tax=Tundrisphaera lichenicola TaxID=2029860 RepID=UPI003EBA1FA9